MAELHSDVRFEKRDVRVGPVVWFLVGLICALAVAMLGLWRTQAMFVHSADSRQLTLPPEPRIEGLGLDKATHSVTNPELPTSAQSQRQRENQMLRDGWKDAGGKWHPPIAEAMKLLLEREKKQ